MNVAKIGEIKITYPNGQGWRSMYSSIPIGQHGRGRVVDDIPANCLVEHDHNSNPTLGIWFGDIESLDAFSLKLIVDLLIAMGYGGTSEEAGRAIGQTGDDGVDGVIDQDPLGVNQIYLQAKRYGEGNNIRRRLTS